MYWFERFLDVLRQLRGAARAYDTGLWQQVVRLHRLRSRHRFLIDDAILWGLTDPAIPEKHLDRYPARILMNNVMRSVNDRAALPDLSDKARFCRLCGERGLRVPPCHGVHRPPHARRRAEPAAASVDFASLPDGGYVAKPVWGEQGIELVFFSKSGERFEVEGEALDAAGIRARLESSNHYSSDYLVQSLLQPHPELAAISGGPGLQCLRIVTYLDSQGDVHLLFARFKFVDRDNRVDNFHKGEGGNLVADVDLDSGRVVKVVAKAPHETVVRSVAHHPGTGRELHIVLPCWGEAVALVKAAARAFPTTRCLGWDVALTSEGAVLIEGNVYWHAFPFATYRKPEPAAEWDRLLRGEALTAPATRRVSSNAGSSVTP